MDSLLIDEVALKVAMAEHRIRHLGDLAQRANISHGYARSIARGLIPGPQVRARIIAVLGVDPWRPAQRAA